jgi:hypothetical protein
MAVDQLSKLCPDGTVLGQSAADLVGFYGKTPVAQPTSSNQAAAGTTAAVTGGAGGSGAFATTTQAQAAIVLIDAMRSCLVNNGLMKGS